MFCIHCGSPNPDSAKFCNDCGKVLNVQPPAPAAEPDVVLRTFSAATTPRSGNAIPSVQGTVDQGGRWIWLLTLAILCVIALALAIHFTSSVARRDSTDTDTPSGVITATPEATLHPYDLVRNPFQYRDRLITLDVRGWPMLVEGQVIQYAEPDHPISEMARRLGMEGVRFDRMLSETTALYDVTGQGTSTTEILRQLAVVTSQPLQPTAERDWEVEPDGTIQGTNGFGATIELPIVRFVRYADDPVGD